MKTKIFEGLLKNAIMPLIQILLSAAGNVADLYLKGGELSTFWKKVIIAADFLGKLFRKETVDSTETPIDNAALDEAHKLFSDTAQEGEFKLVSEFPIPIDPDEDEPE